LVIGVAILGVVSVVLAGAFIVAERTKTDTADRFKESHDTQIAAAYLANDVQTMSSIADPCASGENLVSFANSDGSTTSYSWDASTTRVSRTVCNAGANAVTPIARLVNTKPDVTCTGGCSVGSRPNKVKVRVAESSGYTYTLVGTRRLRSDTSALVVGDYPRLLILKNGSVTTSGNGTVTVNGNVILNPGASASGSGFSYGTIEVTDGSCGSRPRCSVRQQEVPDPFAGLPLPRAAGRPVYTDGNPAHGPGVYRSTPLTFPNGDTVLQAGEYIVESGFSLAGKARIIGSAGVLLYNGCAADSTGCSNSGRLSIEGNSQYLTLEPYRGGDYGATGIVYWQPPGNTQPFTVAGNGETSNLHGVIYAPTANPITLAIGNSKGSVAGWVIGKYVVASGSPGSDAVIGG
jgi:YD repeat-containing protein